MENDRVFSVDESVEIRSLQGELGACVLSVVIIFNCDNMDFDVHKHMMNVHDTGNNHFDCHVHDGDDHHNSN